MSRIQVDPLSPKHEIVVGYDSPLETFFGQVFDRDIDNDPNSDEDPVVFRVGSNLCECESIAELREHMEPYCIFNAIIVLKLEADYLSRSEPTPLQKWGRSL